MGAEQDSPTPALRDERQDRRLRRLSWFLLFRVFALTLILAVILLTSRSLSSALDPTLPTGSAVFLLLAGLYLASALSGLVLRSRPRAAVPVFYVLLVTDLLATTYAVLLSGGAESGWTALYLVLVLGAALVDGRRGAALAMGLAATFFLGSTALAQSGALPALPSGRPPARHPIPNLVRAWGLNLAALAVVTLLAIHLADQLEQTARELSERQEALDQLSALHRQILESLESGVVTTDERGRVTMANPAARTLLGWNGLGAQPLPPRLPEQLDRPHGLHRVSIQGPDGQERSLQIAVSSLRDPDGRPAGKIYLLQDRTELDRLEAEMAAQERLATLGRFASAVAHEVRNPLAAISGAVELLGRQQAGDTVTERLQAIVLRETARLDELVTKLLEYVKPAQKLHAERLDWAQLLQEAVRLAREDPRAEGVTLELEAEGPIWILADAHRLSQLHWNLLANALEASPKGGRVSVGLRRTENGAELAIQDEGPGIPEEIRKQVFEPFFTTKPQGTGLGLAVVHQIVREHGGRIRIQAAEPQGTLVLVWLPAADSVASDATERPEGSEA